MKKIDTNNRSREELTAMLSELRGKLTKHEFAKAEKNVKNTAESGALKRDIARVLTALNKS